MSTLKFRKHWCNIVIPVLVYKEITVKGQSLAILKARTSEVLWWQNLLWKRNVWEYIRQLSVNTCASARPLSWISFFFLTKIALTLDSLLWSEHCMSVSCADFSLSTLGSSLTQPLYFHDFNYHSWAGHFTLCISATCSSTKYLPECSISNKSNIIHISYCLWHLLLVNGIYQVSNLGMILKLHLLPHCTSYQPSNTATFIVESTLSVPTITVSD